MPTGVCITCSTTKHPRIKALTSITYNESAVPSESSLIFEELPEVDVMKSYKINRFVTVIAQRLFRQFKPNDSSSKLSGLQRFAPAWKQNPSLLLPIIQTLESLHQKTGISTEDRNILRAVLLNTPNQKLITNLSYIANNTNLLSNFIELSIAGLLRFRSWGGQQKSVTQQTSSASKKSIDRILALAGTSIDISTLQNTVTRGKGFREQCIRRQGQYCAVLGREPSHIEGAHILPFSLAQLPGDDQEQKARSTALWYFLGTFLGQQLYTETYQLAFAHGGIDSARNGLALDQEIHHLFDTGRIGLIPVDESPTTDSHYRVQVEIRRGFNSRLMVNLPRNPLAQIETFGQTSSVLAPQKAKRRMASGDIIYLTTSDASRYELPSKAALLLHSMLWRTVGDAGFSEASTDTEARKESLSNLGISLGRVIESGKSIPTSKTSFPMPMPYIIKRGSKVLARKQA